MRYYFDTEFIERGHEHPIELISLGMVREDGTELYAVLADGWDESHASDWVRENVLPHLGDGPRITRAELAQRLRFWITEEKPEFWGYYADYDWVVLCQLFGSMTDLPKNFPMFCRDLKQFVSERGNPELPKQTSWLHNALWDARHIKFKHEWMKRATMQTVR